ncbi:hypothetical protein [Streptomyces sp. NPDC051132]|uniref:hypothetical protein n=1 Tax=unclassified Streptomyces TaxID=2593676 RepID=UPI00341A6FA6
MKTLRSIPGSALSATRWKRRASAVLFAGACTAGLLLAPAAHASAAGTLQTCTGYESQSFNPGLTLVTVPTQTTLQNSFSCTGLSTPDVTNGTIDSTVNRPNSCLTVLVPSVDMTIVWDNNPATTSRFQATRAVVTAAGQTVVTDTGTITSGLFTGSIAERVSVTPAINLLDCVGTGITQRSGTVSFSVLL